ncbi:MAG: hypothetical protein ABH804_02030 [archaeon]
MGKILGYVFSLAGVFALAMTMDPVKKLVPFEIPSTITNTALLIVGGILVVLGIFMIKSRGLTNKHLQRGEVPIYHKGKIVGYRRY